MPTPWRRSQGHETAIRRNSAASQFKTKEGSPMFGPFGRPKGHAGKYAPNTIQNFGGWDWYFAFPNTSISAPMPNKHNSGKWMYFFQDKQGRAFANEMCDLAVGQGIVQEAKASAKDEGVACFYIDGTDITAHQRVIRFFLDHNMIQRTKTGRLYNISFKFDQQTRGGQYGTDFTAQIKLEQFVNLDTGEMLPDPKL